MCKMYVKCKFSPLVRSIFFFLNMELTSKHEGICIILNLNLWSFLNDLPGKYQSGSLFGLLPSRLCQESWRWRCKDRRGNHLLDLTCKYRCWIRLSNRNQPIFGISNYLSDCFDKLIIGHIEKKGNSSVLMLPLNSSFVCPPHILANDAETQSAKIVANVMQTPIVLLLFDSEKTPLKYCSASRLNTLFWILTLSLHQR